MESTPPGDLTYKGYLKLDELLKLQQPLAKPECHDETLFIIVHQVFELWFRLALHEIDEVLDLLERDDVLESARLIRRLTAIVRLFIPKLSVLETMIPSDFIQFRDLLKPASGFQSVQFRQLEFACGLKDRGPGMPEWGQIPIPKRLLGWRDGSPNLPCGISSSDC